MTNIVISIAGIILTLTLPAGALISITTEGEPIDQINVEVTLPSSSPIVTTIPVPTPTFFPTPTPTLSPTPTPSLTVTPTPSPSNSPVAYSNVPQAVIADYSTLPQPQNMLNNANIPNAQPSATSVAEFYSNVPQPQNMISVGDAVQATQNAAGSVVKTVKDTTASSSQGKTLQFQVN